MCLSHAAVLLKVYSDLHLQVDGFAGVYPEHKHSIVEALQAQGRLVGMTGRAAFLGPLSQHQDISAQAGLGLLTLHFPGCACIAGHEVCPT